ncbi:MAG TPA: hypothetical protein VMC83_30315 [Streptosporangiaceae bacterium]|nr:hypothetical protein [Streptosporangiaceae bacterium]
MQRLIADNVGANAGESYSLILGESAFGFHGRRLTGGQRVPVDEPGCSLGGLRVPRHAQPGEIRLTDVDVRRAASPMTRPGGDGRTRVM